MDKIMMAMFVKMLKRRKNPDEKTMESITIIENGFDGVKEESLNPVLDWISKR
jgi:hypothetical protein